MAKFEMSREEIISMVQEAIIEQPNTNPFDFRLTNLEQIERFAAFVAAAEREACAKLVEDKFDFCSDELTAAAAIRARGQA